MNQEFSVSHSAPSIFIAESKSILQEAAGEGKVHFDELFNLIAYAK
jgi:hypothetical protein